MVYTSVVAGSSTRYVKGLFLDYRRHCAGCRRRLRSVCAQKVRGDLLSGSDW